MIQEASRLDPVFSDLHNEQTVLPDEVDQISTRTLAIARYKRNHDWMNEVFHHAAFGGFFSLMFCIQVWRC
jgi:hypothetical protein